MRPIQFVLGALLVSTPAFASPAATYDPIDGRLYRNTDGPLSLDMIQEAKNAIDLEIYTVEDPNVLQALERAALRGVRVRIVKDPAPVGGEACPWFQGVTPKPADTGAEPVDCSGVDHFLAVIQDNGGSIVAFDKQRQCGKTEADETLKYLPACYEHGKMMVIDSKTAWLSTGNLDPSNTCLPGQKTDRCNRDFSWEISDGGLVGSLETLFEHDFRNSADDLGAMIRSGEIDPRLSVSPFARQDLIGLIDSAQSSILLQNQYLKDPEMNQALIRAAGRGVSVKVEVSSFCAFGKPASSERAKAQRIYQAFDAAGIQSRIFSSAVKVGGHAGYLHAKWIVVDGARGWVGSTNGSSTAIDRNREFGVFFTNRDAISLLSDTFQGDFQDSGSESWSESLDCAKDFVP